MYPKIWFIDSYALFLTLGVICALFLFELYFRKVLKETPEHMFLFELLGSAALLFGMMGAYLLQNLYDFVQDPANFSWSWRATFFGGFLFGVGGWLLLYFLFVRKKFPDGLKKILVITPASIASGHAFGRIGCFMEGCCYGKASDAWYAIYFPTLQRSVIPTQLFEAIFLFLLSGVLIFLAFRFRTHFTIPVYTIGYGIWRFLVEFLRDDYRGSLIPGISPSQFWALLLFVFGVGSLVFLLLLRKRKQTA